MTDLAHKIRESRRLTVEVNGKKFHARRLTWLEYAKISSGRIDDFDALIQMELVTGWENVQEKDISPGGGDDQVPFSRSLFNVAIEDWPEEYQKLSTHIVEKTREFFRLKGENEKNSGAGTTKASEKQKSQD